jgi:rubrerythrin
MSEGHSKSYERIKGKKTLKEILEVATSFERAARDFYTDLAPKVSKNIRYLVLDLADEEQRHYDLFNRLAKRTDLEEQVKALVDTPASDGKFSDCVHLPDLGEKPDDQAVLQYALGREHAAMEQYTSLAESAEPGPIKDLFIYLADEETQHKAELEKLYYQVVHAGGV